MSNFTFPFKPGQPVYIAKEVEKYHYEKERGGWDHLGPLPDKEVKVHDGWKLEIKKVPFRYGLLDDYDVNDICTSPEAARERYENRKKEERERKNDIFNKYYMRKAPADGSFPYCTLYFFGPSQAEVGEQLQELTRHGELWVTNILGSEQAKGYTMVYLTEHHANELFLNKLSRNTKGLVCVVRLGSQPAVFLSINGGPAFEGRDYSLALDYESNDDMTYCVDYAIEATRLPGVIASRIHPSLGVSELSVLKSAATFISKGKHTQDFER